MHCALVDASPSLQSAPCVLLVEDEVPIRDGLTELFGQQGFRIVTAADGIAASELLLRATFDLVILDLMLPKLAGLQVLARLRQRDALTPVLVLTAKDTEEDIVRGIEAGADDYVTKPFGIRELLARARGLLRRSRPVDAPRSVRIGRGTLDLDTACFREEGATAVLTTREAQLLAHLALPPGRVVGRAELLVQVWGYQDGTVQTRTVDVHIQQLREKLPRGNRRIVTVRGRGYRLELDA